MTTPAQPRVVLRGDTAALHDALTGTEGDFAHTLQRLADAAGTAICEIAIVADNLAALPQIVALALARGLARCELVVDDLVPLAELVPALTGALASCRAAGVAAFVRGVPPCLLPEGAPLDLEHPPPADAACLFEAVCELSERCPKLSHTHVHRFGWEERRLRRNALLSNAEAGRYGAEIRRRALAGTGLKLLADELETLDARNRLCTSDKARRVHRDAPVSLANCRPLNLETLKHVR